MRTTFEIVARGLAPVACLVAFWVGSAEAAPPQVDPRVLGFDPAKLAAIDGVIEKAIADGQTPGAVICVGRSGGIGFLKPYGLRQVEPTAEPMTVDTVFDMASITKPVATATCVMRLVQEGKLAPEDLVAKHLPEFGNNGKEPITVAQLLTHTSGLIPDNALSDYSDGPEMAWERIFALKPVAEPGTAFKYSDVNFLVLGKLVERLSGMPLNEYAKQVTFGPLGMTDTGYLPGDDLKRRAAATEETDGRWLKGEVHDPRASKLGGVAGHAGLFSTATDMATYATALLESPFVRLELPLASRSIDLKWEDGSWSGNQFPLSWETIRLMAEGRELPGGARRALGWDSKSGYSSNRGENFSDRAFGHGGFTGTVLWIDPGLDLYVIWLSTRLHPDGKGNVNPIAGRVGTIAAGALTDRETASEEPVVSPVLTGIDVLKRDGFAQLKGRKVGLITNHTGRSREGETTAKLIADAEGVELVTLFSPEHGFEGKLDHDGIGDSRDPVTGAKVYSLYGETRTPTAAMLADLDTLVFDIQDIGARFYTYPSTMGNAMKAAAEHGKRFVVLDRPNPIGGTLVEGPVLDAGRESFVGFHTIAVRHGMTIGEMATMYRDDLKLDLDLEVIKAEGWRRGDYFEATGLTWVNPSPNMRSLAEATLYPGIGLLETTNVSVGRGTDTPFEVLGAPWIDGVRLATALNEARLPGVAFVPVRFTPDASKHANEECGGINILVTDRGAFRPVVVGLTIAHLLRKHHPEEWDTKSLDRLLIERPVADAILAGTPPAEIEKVYAAELEEFVGRRGKHLLYE